MTVLWLTLLFAVVSMLHASVGHAGGSCISGSHGVVGGIVSGDETHNPGAECIKQERNRGLHAAID